MGFVGGMRKADQIEAIVVLMRHCLPPWPIALLPDEIRCSAAPRMTIVRLYCGPSPLHPRSGYTFNGFGNPQSSALQANAAAEFAQEYTPNLNLHLAPIGATWTAMVRGHVRNDPQ